VITYQDFLERKRQLGEGTGFDPEWMPDFLFPFQQLLVTWAIRQGRGAIFADCGLGKTPMQLVWAENVRQRTGKPVLIVTPLAVSFQTEIEAAKFGIDAAVSRDGVVRAPVVITNYERLEKFQTDQFGGVVSDESSAIKAFDGVRRAIVTEFLRTHEYRLLCTATAAPNDYIELGTSSEALGYLGHMDMLNRFFTNKQNTSATNRYRGQRAEWRFKGHAEDEFWRWVSSWARAIRKPSEYGFPDDGFQLPPLEHEEHVVATKGDWDPDALFNIPANGLREERAEARATITERCEMAAKVLADADSAVAWCQLNDEGNLLAKVIPDSVQISGSDSPDSKEEKLIAFSTGQIRTLITKPIIGAWGLNWQHCHRMSFFPSHSYEQYYQAVRRSWRFGQKQPVLVDIITTEGGGQVLANLQRKAQQADAMFKALVGHMQDALKIDRSRDYTTKVQVPSWLS